MQLSSDSAPILKSQTLSMDNSMKSVSGTELFDHLASCVADFINKVHNFLLNKYTTYTILLTSVYFDKFEVATRAVARRTVENTLGYI